MALFSIITCTRNSMATIKDTLDSVQNQDCQDIEHIFVDGNSTDGTLDYLRSLPGNIRILEGVEGGISRAMNQGITAATGTIICHLHSDDYFLHPRVLSRVAASLESTQAKWLYGRILNDYNGALLAEPYRAPRFSHRRLLRGNFIPHPASFICRSVFNELGLFDETLKYAMDYDFFLRISARYFPAQIPEVLTVFRRHAGSASNANWLAAFEEMHQVKRRYLPNNPLIRSWSYFRYRCSHYKVVRSLTVVAGS